MAHAVNDSYSTRELLMAMKLQDTYLNADGHVATREKELLEVLVPRYRITCVSKVLTCWKKNRSCYEREKPNYKT